ncbi:MAG: hypothetical protein ACE5FD_13945 [Anaerolineae bacterium]
MSPKLVSIAAFILLILAGSALTPIVQAQTAVPDTAAVISADLAAVPAPQSGDDAGSSLPEGLSRIFASLGLYIVTMFTMAIGTEIVVDALKLALGFKSKPTAQKTLAQYEAVLPGKMADLGIAAEAQQNLQNQLATMKNAFKPIFKAEQVITDLQEENFTAALTAIAGENPQQSAIDNAVAVTKKQLHAALDNLPAHSALAETVTANLRQRVDELVDNLAAGAVEITPEAIFRQARALLNDELADGVTSWAEAKLAELETLSYQGAVRVYEMDVRPLLTQSGLNAETERKIHLQFENFLENTRISQHAEIFLKSLNTLLVEVENQRDQLSSHWRRWIGRFLAWINSQASWLSWIPYRMKPALDPTIHDPADAASALLKIERRDKAESTSRVQQLRLTSVIIGIIIAYFLQVDSADLLGDLFPGTSNFLKVALIAADATLFDWIGNLFRIQMHTLTAGVILTGLAASAGSGFWHDQLSRLQSVQQGVETAYTALKSVTASQQTGNESNSG